MPWRTVIAPGPTSMQSPSSISKLTVQRPRPVSVPTSRLSAMGDVPAGWRSMRLKDTGTWLSGGTPSTDDPRYWDGDIPWISAASLKDFRISRSDRCVTRLGALSGTCLVPQGTVLFVVRGMSLKTEFRVGVTERQVTF